MAEPRLILALLRDAGWVVRDGSYPPHSSATRRESKLLTPLTYGSALRSPVQDNRTKTWRVYPKASLRRLTSTGSSS